MQNLLSKIIEIRKLTVWSEWRCIDNLGYFNTLKKYFKIVELEEKKTLQTLKSKKLWTLKAKKLQTQKYLMGGQPRNVTYLVHIFCNNRWK